MWTRQVFCVRSPYFYRQILETPIDALQSLGRLFDCSAVLLVRGHCFFDQGDHLGDGRLAVLEPGSDEVFVIRDFADVEPKDNPRHHESGRPFE